MPSFRRPRPALWTAIIFAVVLFSALGLASGAELAAAGSRSSAPNPAAPTCCAFCNYSQANALSCCCARQRAPVTSTKVLTRWKTATSTRSARAGARNLHDRRSTVQLASIEVGEPSSDDDAEITGSANIVATEVETNHGGLFARHLCPPCPAGRSASFSAPCCPTRVTRTATVVRTRTKTVAVAITRSRTSSSKTSAVSNPVPTVVVSGFVFTDLNGNGVYESGEPLLSGVALLLQAAARTVLLSNTTSKSDGTFTFTILKSLVPTGKSLFIVLEQSGALLLTVPPGPDGLPRPTGNDVPIQLSATSTATNTATRSATKTLTKSATKSKSTGTATVTASATATATMSRSQTLSPTTTSRSQSHTRVTTTEATKSTSSLSQATSSESASTLSDTTSSWTASVSSTSETASSTSLSETSSSWTATLSSTSETATTSSFSETTSSYTETSSSLSETTLTTTETTSSSITTFTSTTTSPCPVNQAIVNGGFETGDLSNWTFTPGLGFFNSALSVGSVLSTANVSSEGTYFFKVAAGSGDSDVNFVLSQNLTQLCPERQYQLSFYSGSVNEVSGASNCALKYCLGSTCASKDPGSLASPLSVSHGMSFTNGAGTSVVFTLSTTCCGGSSNICQRNQVYLDSLRLDLVG